MDFISRIYANSDNLSETEKVIVAFILNHMEQCLEVSIMQLASKVHVSKSTLHRCILKLGFKSYLEFKYMLQGHYNDLNKEYIEEEDMLLEDIKLTSFLNAPKKIDGVCMAMKNASNLYLYATGFGQQNCLTEFIRNLISVGVSVMLLPSFAELEIKINTLIKGKDLLMIVALSGNTPEILPLLKQLRLKNISIVTLTNNQENSLGSVSNYHLRYQTTPFSFKSNNYSCSLYSFVPCSIVLEQISRRYIMRSLASD